eukprot:350067_1
MDSFLIHSDQIRAVFAKLASNPLFVLKPVSTWKESDPLYFTLWLLIVMTAWTYYKNKTTDDCSFVDRVWSIAPILYSGAMTLHYYVQNNYQLHDRLCLTFMMILGWGVRLSYNLYIKGGYKTGKEDHRWGLIRTWYTGKTIKWNLFVFWVVNVWQMVAIYAFSALPLYIIYHGPSGTQLYDMPLAIMFCFFLAIETFADDQMFQFQEGKKEQIRKRRFSQIKDYYLDGFYHEGLYRYSRHPNYFGELGQWWVIYWLSCVGHNKAISPNWSVIGILHLCFIFYKSLHLTESITNFKYPKYKLYAKRTSKFFLWPPKPEENSKKTD